MKNSIKRLKTKQAQLFFYFDNKKSYNDRSAFIDDIVVCVKDSPVGYAGFGEKKYLSELLQWSMFDSDVHPRNFKISRVRKDKIVGMVDSSITVYSKLLDNKERVYIHLFPTFSRFVPQRMQGISGFTPYKNSVLMFLSDNTVSKLSIQTTLSHEYNHAIYYQNFQIKNLADAIIFEGLAEHFSCDMTKQMSKYALSMSRKKALQLFTSLRRVLTTTNITERQQLFTWGDKYPLWAGYAIGYYVVDLYRRHHPQYEWKKLIRTSPKVIMNDIKKILAWGKYRHQPA